MDNYTIKPPKAKKLIRWLFNLISLVVIVAIGLIFWLQIHEVVDAPQGEIIAQNVPIEYIAPFESEVLRVQVRQGEKVKKEIH